MSFSDTIFDKGLVLVESSQPNLEERLENCEACGFKVRWVWSAYDAAFLAALNWSPK